MSEEQENTEEPAAPPAEHWCRCTRCERRRTVARRVHRRQLAKIEKRDARIRWQEKRIKELEAVICGKMLDFHPWSEMLRTTITRALCDIRFFPLPGFIDNVSEVSVTTIDRRRKTEPKPEPKNNA